MNARKVAVVVGSIRKGSFNRMLANALVKLAPRGLQFEMVRIDDLPVYSQDLDETPPESVVRLKAQVTAAHAVLFVTPEHNRSIPTALKNALDWASRPYGKSVWAGKPAAVCGTSAGAIGTACAQQHLRNILAYLDMPTLGQPEAFIQFTEGLIDNAGNVANEGTRKFLQGFIDRFAAWVDKLAR
jgi:chromate reductase